MPRAATTPGLDAGLQLEVRVSQVWFWDGYYVRRGIDLQHRFRTEVSTVTDLDILAFAIDQALRTHTYIGEVKSGRSSSTPKPLDRAIWARGLRELVNAESAEITTAFRTSLTVREFANRMGVTIQHVDDLATRESRLAIDEVSDTGSQGETVTLLVSQVARHVRADSELERAFWFLRSEVWFLDTFDALKRTLGLIRQLRARWPADNDEQGMRTVRWLYAEAISTLTLHLVRAAGAVSKMDSKSFVEFATDKLSTGDIPSHNMQKLSDRVDEYISKLLSTTNAAPELLIEALGAFAPTPPEYLEPLLELMVRLSVSTAASARLPRQVDAIVFERLVRRRNIPEVFRVRLALDSECERLLRLIGAFLRGQFSLPPAVDRVLTTELTSGEGVRPDTPTQESLFS